MNDMKRRKFLGAALTAAGGSLLLPSFSDAAEAGTTGASTQITTLLKQAVTVPTPTEVTMLTLDLPPGAESTPHRHSGPVFGYVLEGEFVFQIEGGELMNLKAGQTFYEPLGAIHKVSKNPSKTARARILAIIVGQQGQPIRLPVTATEK